MGTASKAKVNVWTRFVMPWWRRRRAAWKRPKTGRELAQDQLADQLNEKTPGVLIDRNRLIDAFQMTMGAVLITALMIFVAAIVFSRPGLVDWIGGWFAENCRVNRVCDFNANMASFAVANVILAVFTTFFMIMVFWWNADDDHFGDLAERLDLLDSSDMEIVGQIGDLRDQVEEWRHERVPTPSEDPLAVSLSQALAAETTHEHTD